MKKKTLEKFVPETALECNNLECQKCYYFTPDYCEGIFCYAKQDLYQGKSRIRDTLREKSEILSSGDIKPAGMKLEIEVLSFLDGYHKEELEDKIKDFLSEYGVNAKINSSTGNELTVNPTRKNFKK